MSRTIIVGDIHACRDELEDLLERVGLVRGDRVIAVGDLVVRGPDPAGTLDLLRRVGARAVRGNHEDRLLVRRARPSLAGNPTGATQRTADQLGPEHWSWLAQLDYFMPLPEHDVVVVHAGVLPDRPVESQPPKVMMYLRALRADGEPILERIEDTWGRHYPTHDGVPHIVFGHHALERLQLFPRATGLDTGCVYGGRLTALVLAAGRPPPPVAQRHDAIVSVPARARYAPG